MGREAEAKDGTVVMKRIWRGRKVVLMAFTKTEWPAWKNQMVDCAEEGSLDFKAEDLLANWEADGCEVVWPTAADFNAIARDFEQSRHAGLLAPMAAEMRDRARQAARDQMSVF